ncbi:hypothetical protein PHYSODRAFT_298877 [Phytophthora sojae]|uniref:Uncharacterized protein n=1 Tax=Phytophthora sojae (strain P6497) TaxID=1094619 RepID=G4Z629_PHYSP|nr:hypothetical protein PHYSODRAFT_298877 [Phytophthora sojae]EGZ20950.1 hypothetical protein PHYSODRAFT_298877 [Phytophthora sojae]|eukprot:XP_009523667.1 hypothetical protein PHYSODRAFT_298877 [Phytophthora sojae]
MHLRTNNKHAPSDPGQNAKSKRLVPWDGDSVGQGGPTSLDVLVGWLKVPGHIEQWSKKKRDASLEILSMLEANGIRHRTASAVQSKIEKLVNQFVSAVRILRSSGQPSDHLESEVVDEDVEAAVTKECPEYRVLLPIFRRIDLRDMGPKDWTTGDDSGDSGYDGGGGNAARNMMRKATDGISGSRRSKRRRSTQPALDRMTAADTADTESTTQAEAGSSAIVPATFGGAAAEVRRKMEACHLQQVEKVCELRLATEQVKDECEVAVARCRLETEQYRGETEKRREDL